MVTPDGYDHDGVDINMTDAESGLFGFFLASLRPSSVSSAFTIISALSTLPNNPLSKWYLKLTERFRKEAEEREAQNRR